MSRRPSPPTQPGHPWIASPVVETAAESVERDPLWKDAVLLDGPAHAGSFAGSIATDDPDVPLLELVTRPSVCVMGLHGGAGASTLTRLLGGGALDTELRWPVYAGWARPRPSVPVIAVARTHYVGLEAVSRFARLWAGNRLPDSRLIALVLIDDGPKLLKDQQLAVRRAAAMLPKNGHIVWQESWRLSSPSLQAAPPRVRRLITQLQTLALSTNGVTK